jgi:trehalose/maltose hydrolase-like predicted phosphorylase
MFPWQSGSDGREESQKIHLNPQSGRWIADVSHLQYHVNSAVAFNVWNYYQVTDDKEFLYYFGAEMILEIARFWSSIAHFNPDRGRFEIHEVMGPDEYHTAYPGAQTFGINNNAYTNFMAAWVIHKAFNTLQILDEGRRKELLNDLELDDRELDKWERVCSRMFIPFNCGVIEQYEGFCDLKELDWESYRTKYGDSMRLDRILESENDSVNNYKAGKQADALMLFYLFSIEELTAMLATMGYDFSPQTIFNTIDYYRNRTAHGSSLSRIVFSWVTSRSDRNGSWDIFKNALGADFKNIKDSTTSEGIHLGAMAGTVDLIQRCYTDCTSNRACPRRSVKYASQYASAATGSQSPLTTKRSLSLLKKGGAIR